MLFAILHCRNPECAQRIWVPSHKLGTRGRCPLCGELLYAMSEHMLIAPEGNAERRRHAHTDCVLEARKAGRLPTFDEWRRTGS